MIQDNDTIKLSFAETSTIKNPFITQLYTNFFKVKSDPTLEFFYSYQIIEYLISEKFKSLLVDLKRELVLGDTDINIVKARKIINKFTDGVKEEARLRKVLQDCSIPQDETQQIRDIFKKFLKKFGNDDVNDLAEELYLIRNLLFHNFERVQPLANLSDLSEIAEAAFRLSTLLLASYKHSSHFSSDTSSEHIETRHWLTPYFKI